MYPSATLDGLQRSRRISSAPLDLRAMITPVGALPEAPAVVIAAPIIGPVVSVPFAQVEAATRKSSLMAFGLVAITLATTGATTAAYSVNLSNTSVQSVSHEAATVKIAAPVVAVAPAAATADAALATTKAASVQALLDSFTGSDRSNWGIVVVNLKTGETGSVNADRQMVSASLYKLFVAQGIYAKLDSGALTYDSSAGPGATSSTVRSCLNLMITISDNTCAQALGAKLGWEEYNETLRDLGYSSATDMTRPYLKTSAADVAKLLKRVYAGTFNSPTSSSALVALLKAPKEDNRLPQGLPAGTIIAHKTGDLEGYVHDAGIVYGPKSNYLVVAMSGPWAYPASAAQRFAQLSARLYTQFER